MHGVRMFLDARGIRTYSCLGSYVLYLSSFLVEMSTLMGKGMVALLRPSTILAGYCRQGNSRKHR